MKEKGYVRIGRLFGGNAEVILGLYLIEWLIESNEIKYEQSLRTEKHSDWISWSLFSRMHREFMSKHCIGIIKLEYYESSNVIGIFTAGHIRTFNMLDFAEELSVQFSSVTRCVLLFAAAWTTACQPSLSITNSWSWLKLMSIESVMPSNRLILCNPLLLLPSIFPSIRVFSNESVLCIRWPKYWSFSFSISPSNEEH